MKENTNKESINNNIPKEGNVAETNKNVTKSLTQKYGYVDVKSKGFSKLNVRKDPSQNSHILRTVDDGEKIEILGQQTNGFYKIKDKINKEGYCLATYIRLELV